MKTNQPRPTASILVPTYNREKELPETLQSAIRQTFSDIEIVVVDNASTDNSWDVIRRFAEMDSRIRAYRNSENIGPVRNWIRCIDYARGLFSKILWSDDAIHPRFLEATLSLLADSRVGFVYTSVEPFGDGSVQGRLMYDRMLPRRFDSEVYVRHSVLGSNWFPVSPGCAVFRTADLRGCELRLPTSSSLGDPLVHGVGPDLAVYLQVASRYPLVAYVRKPLSRFRVHAGSITILSHRGQLSARYMAARSWFVEQFRPDLAWSLLWGKAVLRVRRPADSFVKSVSKVSRGHLELLLRSGFLSALPPTVDVLRVLSGRLSGHVRERPRAVPR